MWHQPPSLSPNVMGSNPGRNKNALFILRPIALILPQFETFVNWSSQLVEEEEEERGKLRKAERAWIKPGSTLKLLNMVK